VEVLRHNPAVQVSVRAALLTTDEQADEHGYREFPGLLPCLGLSVSIRVYPW